MFAIAGGVSPGDVGEVRARDRAVHPDGVQRYPLIVIAPRAQDWCPRGAGRSCGQGLVVLLFHHAGMADGALIVKHFCPTRLLANGRTAPPASAAMASAPSGPGKVAEARRHDIACRGPARFSGATI